jgi:hypothetical protein
MRQASWIAFLLLTVGLLTYDAAVDQGDTQAADEIVQETNEKPEGGMVWPPPRP